jgi:hypothetical protein
MFEGKDHIATQVVRLRVVEQCTEATVYTVFLAELPRPLKLTNTATVK